VQATAVQATAISSGAQCCPQTIGFAAADMYSQCAFKCSATAGVTFSGLLYSTASVTDTSA
jgi:hypothetical protein